MEFDKYLALDLISSSALKPYAEFSDLDVRMNLMSSRRDEPSTDMMMGTLIHALTMNQPINIGIHPRCQKKSKKDRLEWIKFIKSMGSNLTDDEILAIPSSKWIDLAYQSDRIIVSDDQYVQATAIAMELKRKYKNYYGLNAKFDHEVTVTDGTFKIRCDSLSDDKSQIIDLKTIGSLADIKKSYYKYKYGIQSALYKRVIKDRFNIDPEFTFIFVERGGDRRSVQIKESHETMAINDRMLHIAIKNYIKKDDIDENQIII